MISSITLHMIKELSLWVFVGAILSGAWIVPLINFLYKVQFTVTHLNMPSKINAEWMKIHGSDTGTPTNGGILIWLTATVVLLGGFWTVPLFKAIGLIVFILGAYGFAEKVVDTLTKSNIKFREFQNGFEWRVGKLLLFILVNVIVALLIVYTAGITSFTLFGSQIALNSWYGIILLSVASTLFSYSTEIIDGIDALSVGMFIISFVGLALLMLSFPALFMVGQSTTAIVIVGLFLGIFLVYSYFNIPPARVFMGESGAMPIGPVILTILLFADMIPAALILIAPYALDLASTVIQLFSLRFFKKKVFLIAPVHHHFEALGWSGPKVVMRAWLLNWFFIFLAVIVQIFLNT